MTKSVLIITNYYPPEMGAAANRIQTLAHGLYNQGFKVQVVCPLPNYPHGKIFNGYPEQGPFYETIQNIEVIRLSTYATNSTNPYKRFKAMAQFANSVKRYLKKEWLPNRVVVQCPPLLVGYSALKALKRRGVKTVVNISDLWPLAALELGAIKKQSFVYSWMLRMEAYIYKNADCLLGQSNEILAHIQAKEPNARVQLYRNFPQLAELQLAEQPNKAVKLIYAGLMGAAQGMLDLVSALELPASWELHLYGNGSESDAIKQYCKQANKAIYFHGPVAKADLHQKLSHHHIALVPLRTRIYGSVPSKIFELAHFGLPVIYLGSGEAQDIIEQYALGWVCAALDVKALNSLVKQLEGSRDQWPNPKQIQRIAQEKFNPKKQVEALAKLLD